MKPVSAQTQERSRKNEASILKSLARHGQVNVAERMGVHESTVSNMKGEKIEKIAAFVAACGLKIVDEGMQCYRPKDINPYLQIAKQHMKTIHSAEQLIWDEE